MQLPLALTVSDQAWLTEIGVADAPPVQIGASSPVARVLHAAAAGMLTGPNLHTATDWRQLQRYSLRIGVRSITDVETRATADLVYSGHLAWVGCRITATAKGRELLAIWA